MAQIIQTLFIPFFVLGIGLLMILVEKKMPGRNWPQVPGWYARAILLNSVQILTVILAGFALDGWMVKNRPWNVDFLGVTSGSVLGYFVITFVYYWWHRWRHEYDFLWLWFHQVHHSPQRIEVITSFYKHPFELLANGILSSTILYFMVGLGPVAASYAVLLSGLAELIYHWNVSTPYWLGYIFQRPESHCVHHQAGIHSYNYGDLPLWDIVFGTFKNPKQFQAQCGFGDNEHKLGEMLFGVDVNATRGTA